MPLRADARGQTTRVTLGSSERKKRVTHAPTQGSTSRDAKYVGGVRRSPTQVLASLAA